MQDRKNVGLEIGGRQKLHEVENDGHTIEGC